MTSVTSGVGTPGANDNGSGVAAVIELARLLRQEDRRAFEPLLVGRAASSPDPFLRANIGAAVPAPTAQTIYMLLLPPGTMLDGAVPATVAAYVERGAELIGRTVVLLLSGGNADIAALVEGP